MTVIVKLTIIATMFTSAWSRYRDQQAHEVLVRSSNVDDHQADVPEHAEHQQTLRHSFRDTAPNFSRESSPAPLADVDLSELLNKPRPAPLAADLLANVEVHPQN